MWIEYVLYFVTLITCMLAVYLYCEDRFEKKLYSKIKNQIQYRNVNNNWINPNIAPCEGIRLMSVIVAIENENGKRFVQEAYYDPTIKKFRGLTPNFHEKVYAWMPYPEPFNSNNALINNDESGKIETKD